jgi:hypothetical protein
LLVSIKKQIYECDVSVVPIFESIESKREGQGVQQKWLLPYTFERQAKPIPINYISLKLKTTAFI